MIRGEEKKRRTGHNFKRYWNCERCWTKILNPIQCNGSIPSDLSESQLVEWAADENKHRMHSSNSILFSKSFLQLVSTSHGVNCICIKWKTENRFGDYSVAIDHQSVAKKRDVLYKMAWIERILQSVFFVFFSRMFTYFMCSQKVLHIAFIHCGQKKNCAPLRQQTQSSIQVEHVWSGVFKINCCFILFNSYFLMFALKRRFEAKTFAFQSKLVIFSSWNMFKH